MHPKKKILFCLAFITTLNFFAQTIEQQKFTADLDIFVEKKMKDFRFFELVFLETTEDIELTQDHLAWRAEQLRNYLRENRDNLSAKKVIDVEAKFENYRELLKLCKEKTRTLHLDKKRDNRTDSQRKS